MSATGLGDSAVVGDLIVNKKVVTFQQDVTELDVKTRLTVEGVSNFESTVDVFSGASFNCNGRAAFSNVEVFLLGIPTTDPAVFGRVWRNGTDLKVSIG